MTAVHRDVANRSLTEMHRTRRIALLGLFSIVAGCGESPTAPPPPPPAIDGPAAVVAGIVDAYGHLDFARFERLIAVEPGAEFEFHPASPLPDGQTSWDAASELNIHQRMLVPPTSKAGGAGVDAPVPTELQLQRIDAHLAPVMPFAELETPAGLDAGRWRAYEAIYGYQILFDTRSTTDYLAVGRSHFVVIEDLAKSDAELGRFLLYSWRDLGTVNAETSQAPTGVEAASWGAVCRLYAGGGPASPAEFIQSLAEAYRNRDYPAFETLFPAAGSDTPYLYFLSDPLPNGQTNWDVTEELRIQRRMFDPGNPLQGETPVPLDLWLQSITIVLTQISDFVERPDLYSSPTNPEGVDAERWRAIEAPYQVYILFDTQSTTDYRVDGRANFVVLDLRRRLVGVPGKYHLYRWEDLGTNKPDGRDDVGSQAATWSNIKALYR